MPRCRSCRGHAHHQAQRACRQCTRMRMLSACTTVPPHLLVRPLALPAAAAAQLPAHARLGREVGKHGAQHAAVALQHMAMHRKPGAFHNQADVGRCLKLMLQRAQVEGRRVFAVKAQFEVSGGHGACRVSGQGVAMVGRVVRRQIAARGASGQKERKKERLCPGAWIKEAGGAPGQAGASCGRHRRRHRHRHRQRTGTGTGTASAPADTCAATLYPNTFFPNTNWHLACLCTRPGAPTCNARNACEATRLGRHSQATLASTAKASGIKRNN